MAVKHNKGMALITALIVVLIVIAIISSLSINNYRMLNKAINQKVMERANGVMHAAIDFGRAALATSALTSPADTLNDIWAQPIPPTKLASGVIIDGYITDEQSKFNINDLIYSNGQPNPTVIAQFAVLLSYLNIPTTLATNIAYYMASVQFENNTADAYNAFKPPYLPSAKTLVDLSELILVNGMTPAWVYKLNQYVTALPTNINQTLRNPQANGLSSNNTTPSISAMAVNSGSILVNVNTASAVVIAAKSGIPLPIAQRLVMLRTMVPFMSTSAITDFLSSSGIMVSQGGASSIDVNTLATSSQYFTVHAKIHYNNDEFKYVALLYRPSRNGLWPYVMWEHPE